MHAIRLFLDLVLLVLAVFFAACHFNYPRFWWQELVCSATFLWLPIVLLSVALSVVRLYHGAARTWLSVLTASVGSYVVGQTLMISWPYVVGITQVRLANDEGIGIGIFHAQVGASPQQRKLFEEKVRELSPSILVISGTVDAIVAQGSLLERFPYSLGSSMQNPEPLVLLSQFPLLPESQSDLGFGALAGLYSKIAIEKDVVLEFGTVALEGSFSSQSFERSRVSSRRLASLMRNSISPRMVVGDFVATPLSQIVSMYNRQARMRSVFYGEGLSVFANIQSFLQPYANVNAFASAGIEVQDAVVVSGLDAYRRSLFVGIKVPRTTVVPIER